MDNLKELWGKKIEDIDFIHNFVIMEAYIYSEILSCEINNFDGTIQNLAKKFHMSNEVFYGFLLGLKNFIDVDLDSICADTHIKVRLNSVDLHEYISQKGYHKLISIADSTNVCKKSSTLFTVGIMRSNSKNILSLKNYTSVKWYIAKSYNINCIFFSPQDIDATSETINALVIENGKPVRKIVPYPHIVDNALKVDKMYREAIRSLKKRSIFVRNSLNTTKYEDI